MGVHDWTLVDAGIFHAFHSLWISQINNVLNEGLLPQGFYALPEQHAGRTITDLLTLHVSPASVEPFPQTTGGTAVAEAPPRVRRRQRFDAIAARPRSLAIRHVSGHRLIALVEIVSPSNKDRGSSVEEFARKAASALEWGVHLLLVDVIKPGPHDPYGMHEAIRRRLGQPDEPYDLPAEEPLTFAAYAAENPPEAFLEHAALGAALPDVPLFLAAERYVTVPLERTYQGAWRGMPAFWRDVLEGRLPTPA